MEGFATSKWELETMKELFILFVVGVFAVSAVTVSAQELEVGDDAPAFELPGTDGNTHSLAQYKGTAVVLAWFPKAFTGG